MPDAPSSALGLHRRPFPSDAPEAWRRSMGTTGIRRYSSSVTFPSLPRIHGWLQRYMQVHRPLDRTEASRRVAHGEGQYAEFKATTATLKAAIKTLAAFASQDGGGYVFLGIMDDG